MIPNTASQPVIITRFAPSPTGFLHIGGARTALFNWAFARAQGGQFLVRIEDTDRARSTEEAIHAILDGLDWLKLTPDAPPLYQHHQQARHQEIANILLETGHAYRCWCRAEDIDAMRQTAQAEGRPMRYDGRCRARTTPPALDAPFTIRFKMPQEGSYRLTDIVQGDVEVAHDQLDDFIILRSDGTPTYMLSVVVDDHDMNISHIIRGDDHLTNAFRQIQIFLALGWPVPQFVHIPLIHGTDGKKLSKRHGALAVSAYAEMGYLPAAMRNYLARLGWSHGDDELFSTKQLIEWFSLEAIGKSPACFDFDKLNHVNAYHISQADETELLAAVSQRDAQAALWAEKNPKQMHAALALLKQKAKSLDELTTQGHFLWQNERAIDGKLQAALDAPRKTHLRELVGQLAQLTDAQWHQPHLSETIMAYLDAAELKLGYLGPALRACLAGTTSSPDLTTMLYLLGKKESMNRIKAQID